MNVKDLNLFIKTPIIEDLLLDKLLVYENSLTKVSLKYSGNTSVYVYLHLAKSNIFINNYQDILKILKVQFPNYEIILKPVLTNNVKDQIYSYITKMNDKFNQIGHMKIVMRNLIRSVDKLTEIYPIKGLRISVAGKIYGLRHMTKVFKRGKIKFTGAKLQDNSLLLHKTIKNKMGIIGVTYRILLNEIKDTIKYAEN